jgi:DNA/RNA-binding domain of Phe-tRNA-synthetase-like protein
MEVLCQLSYGGPWTNLPLTAAPSVGESYWWGGEDLNLRRLRRQIYSLLPLATRAPPHTRTPRAEANTHNTRGRESFQYASKGGTTLSSLYLPLCLLSNVPRGQRPLGAGLSGRMVAMNGYRYSISADIFACFPGYVRGVVTAYGVANTASPPELVELLREAEQSIRDRVALDKIAEEPRIAAWREAYRAFGAKPSEFRSSVEAMTRRVLRGDELPSINALVDIGNVISLRHLLPAGSHAIDVLCGDIEVRFATGREEFVAFGSNKVEHPATGEVIFAEADTVLTRRWTWRQAQHTLTLADTTSVEFNVDGLPPVTHDEVAAACVETRELVERFCGGHCRVEFLTEASPSISLAS